jgi:hypothetical protein
MAALRQRERENLLLERAQKKAVKVRRKSYAKADRTLRQGIAANYLERLQGKRRAAKLPDLKEDPWLSMVARREAYMLIIEHYKKLLANVDAKLQKTPPPPSADRMSWADTLTLADDVLLPSYITTIGLTVLPDALERKVLIRGNQRLTAKDQAALVQVPPNGRSPIKPRR